MNGEDATTEAVPDNPQIDADEFVRMTLEATWARESRRLSERDFRRMAKQKGAIVLDARSRSLHDLLHVRGAVSLPFTEFTEESLARAIPDRDAPVLIYCNNNFAGAELEFATKAAPAALNLSTFVALWSYGYRNVYELGPFVDVNETKLPLAGENSGRFGK